MSARVLSRACERRIASRPSRSGGATRTWRSKRPGRSSALSSLSIWFDAASTITVPGSRSKPSSSTSSWLSACSRSRGAAVAGAGAAMAADRVELVDEDHRAAGLARLLEEPADAGRAAADEHLDEARARGGEEVDAGLGGDRAGQHRLAGARAARRAARPRGARAPSASKRFGSLSHSATSTSSSLAASTPCTSSQRTGAGLARLDRLRPGRPHRAAQQDDEDDQEPGREEDPEDRVPLEEEVWMDAGRGIEQTPGLPIGRHAPCLDPLFWDQAPRRQPRLRRRASPCSCRPDRP